MSLDGEGMKLMARGARPTEVLEEFIDSSI